MVTPSRDALTAPAPSENVAMTAVSVQEVRHAVEVKSRQPFENGLIQ
jgi:hypothetical protein